MLLPASNVILRSAGVISVVASPFTTDNVFKLTASNAFNCFTFTASKSLEPPATPTIRRLIPLPSAALRSVPTDTTPLPELFTASSDKYALSVDPVSASVTLEPYPKATEKRPSATAPLPSARPPACVTFAPKPIATPSFAVTRTSRPIPMASFASPVGISLLSY